MTCRLRSGYLGAYGALHIKDVSDYLLVGELGLDGSLRAVQGMLPIAVAAREKGIKNLVIPASNAREAAVVEGVNVYPVETLLEVRELLNSAAMGRITATPLKVETDGSARMRCSTFRSTSRMCADSMWRSGRWRWRRRAGITF